MNHWLRIPALIALCVASMSCAPDLTPEPTATTLTPAFGLQGTDVSVSITGTNFVAGGTSVFVSGVDVVATNVNVDSATSLSATFTISASAEMGERLVTVHTAGGTTDPLTFTVGLPVPTLASVEPNTSAQGGVVGVTLTGTNFVADGTTVAVSGADVAVSNVNVTSSTTLTADFTTALAAAVGPRDVTVTTGGGTSGPQVFTIIVGPAITSSPRWPRT